MPQNLTVDSIRSTWADLCWQRPQEVGQPGIAFYTVTARDTSGNSEMVSASTTSNATRLNMTNLLPGISYEFSVQAVAMVLDVEAASEFSATKTGTTSVTGEKGGCGFMLQ